MPASNIPELDDELRLRLRRRFGSAIDAWFDQLTAVLEDLGERWGIEWGTLIQRGSMSVVIRCRAADGRPAVLKLSPERARIAHEAAALTSWQTPHVPAVLAVEESVGALLIEAIEPGTPLVETNAYPSLESIASLLRSLHDDAAPNPTYRPVADHIAYLFESSRKLYEFKPDLAELISPELYERSRELALRLAAHASPTVLLHGDLTPVNVLDGGKERGLVAIDPAPCLGDPRSMRSTSSSGGPRMPTRSPRVPSGWLQRSEPIPDACSTGAQPSPEWSPWRSLSAPAASASRSNPSSRSHRASS